MKPKGKLLSIGSGTRTLEFIIAELEKGWSIRLTEIAVEIMERAEQAAKE